jgi:RNA polymerase sigma factor (sigma-70 family)
MTARPLRPEREGPAVRNDPSVVALVTRAAGSDQAAWDELVDRYAPLVWSICVRFELSSQDIEDVGQNVWLRLVEQLGNLREPAALPGWLATTTRRECLRVVKASRRVEIPGDELEERLAPQTDAAAIEQEIIMAERNALLRAALAELPPRCRQLLSMLISDPPCSYAEISAVLGIRIGSIGPERGRCLERLRHSEYLAGLSDDEFAGAPISVPGSEPHA